MEDKLLAGFDTKGSRVLVGGPLDGARFIPEDRTKLDVIAMPLPQVSVIDFKPDPVGPPLTYATYYPEKLRGNQIEMVFYRHESVSVDQALVLMLARYPKQKDRP